MAPMNGVLADQAQSGPPGAAPAAQPPKLTPQMKELFNLVVARVRAALAQVGPDMDAALKADPVQGAVKFGVTALRSVVQAAQQAGKKLPIEVVIAAGMQAIKDIASIAVDKGYLQEQDLKGFLKEVFQQSVAEYAQMDKAEGVGDPSAQPPGGATQEAAPPPPGVLAQAGAM